MAKEHKVSIALASACVGVILIGMIGYFVGLGRGSRELMLWFKAIPVLALSAWLLALAVLASERSPRGIVLCACTGAATYVFYGIGDTCLALGGKTTFTIGGVSFLVGHCVWLATASLASWGHTNSVRVPRRRRMWLAVGCCLATQAAAITMSSLVRSHTGDVGMGFLVWMYISAFTISSVAGSLWWHHAGRCAVFLVGVVVFLSSDVILVTARFLNTELSLNVPIMVTYWAGCFLLAAPVINSIRCGYTCDSCTASPAKASKPLLSGPN